MKSEAKPITEQAWANLPTKKEIMKSHPIAMRKAKQAMEAELRKQVRVSLTVGKNIYQPR